MLWQPTGASRIRPGSPTSSTKFLTCFPYYIFTFPPENGGAFVAAAGNNPVLIDGNKTAGKMFMFGITVWCHKFLFV